MKKIMGACLPYFFMMTCFALPLAADTVEKGKHVVFHYKVFVRNTLMYDTRRTAPAKMTAGEPGMMRGLADNLIGLKEGETKNFYLKAEDAFGYFQPSRVKKVPKPENGRDWALGESVVVPMGKRLAEGYVMAKTWDGASIVDFNHPLADRHLTYEVEILEVK